MLHFAERKAKKLTVLYEISKRECNEESLSFDIELLHKQRRMSTKKWQSWTAEENENVSSNKKEIIDIFKKETGLIIDTPKQGGGGVNTKYPRGNTVWFSSNSTIFSRIIFIHKELIDRFSVILRVLSLREFWNENSQETWRPLQLVSYAC